MECREFNPSRFGLALRPRRHQRSRQLDALREIPTLHLKHADLVRGTRLAARRGIARKGTSGLGKMKSLLVAHAVIPPPAGTDPSDIESVKAAMSKLPISVFVAVLAGWTAGAFFGGRRGPGREIAEDSVRHHRRRCDSGQFRRQYAGGSRTRYGCGSPPFWFDSCGRRPFKIGAVALYFRSRLNWDVALVTSFCAPAIPIKAAIPK